MNLFRSHIFRLYGFLWLLMGIVFNLATSSEQKVTHAVFKSWLKTHLKNDESEAQKKLNHLSKHQFGTEEIIRRASQVVASHPDDFTLPVGENEETSQELVYHLLLTQWNQFQYTEAGMSKAVLVETAKPHTILPHNGKFNNLDAILAKKPIPNSYKAQFSNSLVTPNSSHLLSPLKSGTAIGAP